MSTEQIDPTFAQPAPDGALQRAAEGLHERGFAVEIVDDADAARELVLGLLEPAQTVFTAVSATLGETGLAAAIDDSGRYRSIRAQLVGLDPLSSQARQLGAAPDVVVGSVQAVCEDGRIVVVSATGSQLGPYAAGAGRVVFVVGAQKIVGDLDSAMRRADTHCLALESERCQRVYGRPSRIYKRLIIERELPGRGTVVLVRAPLGF